MMNTNNAMEVVMVKVGKMPGTIQEVVVEKGASVEGAPIIHSEPRETEFKTQI